MVTTGGGAQISVRSEAPHEQLIGMVTPVDGHHHNRLAFCSFQAEMPNNVQITNKPVVLMTAPEQKQNQDGHGIGGETGPEEDGGQQRPELCGGMKLMDLDKK